MTLVLAFIALLFTLSFLLLRQPKFGKHPRGDRKARILRSPHYKNGQFQNISPTPALTEGASYTSVMREFIFSDKSKRSPRELIPSIKTNLYTLDPAENLLVWFGHSSYFMQIDGKRILVDPVLSGHASPFSFSTKAFQGSDTYKPEDIPAIDFLFLTHDHWDHLDHATLLKLKPKISHIICSLGTGAHLEHWGFEKSMLYEEDWDATLELGKGFKVYTAPARHFSGRGLKRNQVQWTSFVLQTPSLKIFIGGDSGYDAHFKDIGKEYGPFDLVILENGQYDKNWKYIHMMPEEVLMAAQDLDASRLLPVHSSKFSISNHDWDAPLKTITELNKNYNIPLLTPMIGEPVYLDKDDQVFSRWWLPQVQ